MATDPSFIEYIQSQSGLGHALTFKKMFGEYALYLHEKVVALACDNQLYVKATDAGRALLGTVSEQPAYPGSKLYFRIDGEMEDRDLLRRVFETTAHALPLPKVKANTKPKPTAGAATTPGSTRKPAAGASRPAKRSPGKAVKKAAR